MADAGFRRAVCPRIAYMPQGLGKNLYPTLSVFENTDFFGRLFGHGRAERQRRIAELLESTGLARFAQRPAGKLSGGMKQKLCLCCALIHDPDLLILDEPTTGVDPLSRRQFWELIDRIRASRPGMSVLVATAYMEEAARFDWLVAMDAGRVLATGTPAELLSRTGARDLEAAFIALLPEEKRSGHREVVIPPRRSGRRRGGHRGERSDPALRQFRRGRSRELPDRAGGDFRLPRLQRLRQDDHDEDVDRPLASDRREALAVRPAGRCRGHRDPPPRRLHVAGLLALLRADGPAEPGPARPALSCARGRDPRASRTNGRAVRPRGSHGRAARLAPAGQRQRLSLAVALIHQPELLILDEPTSGVDPVARDGFWEHLIELSRRDKVTIFVSTHFINEARRCDRISLMTPGRFWSVDTPDGVVEKRGAATLEDAFIGYLEEAECEKPGGRAGGASRAGRGGRGGRVRPRPGAEPAPGSASSGC